MKKTTIINLAKNSGEIEQIEAELFKIEGYEETFGVHQDHYSFNIDDKKRWAVTELSTGMTATKDQPSKAKAKSAADIRMRSNIQHWPGVKERAIQQLADCQISYPVNTLL